LAQIQDGIINGRFVNLEYTGTFTGGTGVVNLGSGQFYKDATGNVGLGTTSPAGLATKNFTVQNTGVSSTSITAGDYSAGAGSMITFLESMGNRNDGNGTFGGRFGATFRRSDGVAIASDTSIGYYLFGGQWGTDTSFQSAKNLYAASIAGVSEASFTSAIAMPTALSFRTGSTGSLLTTANVNYGTERMRIDSSGNVGIGTGQAGSISKLAVSNSVTTDSSRAGVVTVGYLSIPSFTGTFLEQGDTATTGTTAGLSNASLGKLLFQNCSAGLIYTNGSPLVFGTTSAERMRIQANGFVGIASTIPQYLLSLGSGAGRKLAVYDDGISAGNASGLGIDLSGAGNELSSWVGTTAGGAGQFTWGQVNTTSNAFAEKMRLDGSGNLSIAVTSAIGRLNVRSDDAATAIVAGNVSGTAAYNGALFYNNGFTSLVGQISISGSTASYLSVSDYRLKESVTPMTGALATVAQLKPVTYKWKADGSDGQGFIAHELQAVVPDCVTGDKDAVDAEGKPKYQGVDTSFLVATLTSAIQEQQAIISAMETRLAALEA
jgi:hypothetical protein